MSQCLFCHQAVQQRLSLDSDEIIGPDKGSGHHMIQHEAGLLARLEQHYADVDATRASKVPRSDRHADMVSYHTFKSEISI